MIDCSVGIVTYNNERTIADTLRALALNWPPDLSGHIYIVDNGSTDQTIAIVEKFIQGSPTIQISLIHSASGNCGYGAGHNQVIPLLASRIHIIMNPDIIILNPKSLLAMIRQLDLHPDIGLVMPKIIDPSGQTQYLARRDLTVFDLLLRYLPGRWFNRREAYHTMRDHDYDQPFEVEFASGCLMAMRTADFRSIGGFDPRYFLYAEDADLSRTVRARGFRILYEPASIVEHTWERGSYKRPKMFLIHLKSLWTYFRKWGFRFL